MGRMVMLVDCWGPVVSKNSKNIQPKGHRICDSVSTRRAKDISNKAPKKTFGKTFRNALNSILHQDKSGISHIMAIKHTNNIKKMGMKHITMTSHRVLFVRTAL
jgi:hypothetical protein